MNFYEFYQLLSENTVSQELKKYKQHEFLKKREIVKTFGEEIKKVLFTNSLNNLNENGKNIIANWVLYLYFKKYTAVYPWWLKSLDNIVGKIAKRNAESILSDMGNSIRKMVLDLALYVHYDFISANIDGNGNLNANLASKFNNPNFTPNDIAELDREYHQNLKKKRVGKQGAPGKTILEFGDGYKWVDLERGYCQKEGESMGHCGNVGTKFGDTILSLRDSKDVPHLTFVLNNGILGERKGVGNSKPHKKYHKYIIELLKSPIIKGIGKGNYLPLNDFQLSDLEQEQINELIKIKPEMEGYYYLSMLLNGKEVSEEIINRLIKDSSDELDEEILKAKPSKKVIEALYAKYKDHDEHKNRISEKSQFIIIHIASNPNTDKHILMELFEKYYKPNSEWHYSLEWEVIAAVVSNHNTPAKILTKVLEEDQNTDLTYFVSTNPNTPSNLLADMFNKGRVNVLSNPNLPEEILRSVVNSERNGPMSEIQKTRLMYVASNKNCPSDLLTKLSMDKDSTVRERVAANKNTNIDTLKRLANDEDEKVRSLAKHLLAYRMQGQ